MSAELGCLLLAGSAAAFAERGTVRGSRPIAVGLIGVSRCSRLRQQQGEGYVDVDHRFHRDMLCVVCGDAWIKVSRYDHISALVRAGAATRKAGRDDREGRLRID